MTSTHDEITAFLAEWTAAEQKGDAAYLDTHLTDDFVGVGPFGFMLPKPAWLGRFESGLSYESFRLDEVQVRVYGDAAVVVARAEQVGTFGGNPVPEATRATLVAVRQPDGWRVAGIHFSFVAGTAGAPPMPGQP